MIAYLRLVLHVVVLPFKTRAQLEAEIILLRHQLNVLGRRVPTKPRLTVADRLLFVWLYRLFPSVLNAVTIVLSLLKTTSGHTDDEVRPGLTAR